MLLCLPGIVSVGSVWGQTAEFNDQMNKNRNRPGAGVSPFVPLITHHHPFTSYLARERETKKPLRLPHAFLALHCMATTARDRRTERRSRLCLFAWLDQMDSAGLPPRPWRQPLPLPRTPP